MKKGIFKGDNSLYTLFSRLWARLILVLTPHISGHLMKPIIYTVVFTGAVRNVKSSKYGKNEPKTAKSVIFL